MALRRSYLFAPGNNEKLLRKVLTAGADAAVLDLEDAVPPSEKAQARRLVAGLLERRSSTAGIPIYVRINGTESGCWEEDLAAVVLPGLQGIRVPKAESAEDVRRVEGVLAGIEVKRGLPVGGIDVVCTVETARGVWAAAELAGCPRVTNLTFGAADFAQDAGMDPGPEEIETLVPRTRLVLASRMAGIDPPVASVFTRLGDEEGLRRSTEAARRLGYFGRSVIHPRQVPVVHGVFTPAPEALAQARMIVETFELAAAQGKGTAQTADGLFVDVAVVRRARGLLSLARAIQQQGKDAES
ncbi:MAG: CoA ester lyase [Acidobacteria bacterium]|nr:CoA ester lyase [Acidobacteriota bacterium]